MQTGQHREHSEPQEKLRLCRKREGSDLREGTVGSFQANRPEKDKAASREAEEDQLGAGRGFRQWDQISGR